jgi:hypothetical protein
MNNARHRWAEEVRVRVEALRRIRADAKVQARLARTRFAVLAANFRAFKDEIVREARRAG